MTAGARCTAPSPTCSHAAATTRPSSLAHHAYNAQRWDDAVRHLWQAAVRSEQRSAYPQAQRFLAMGLDAAAHLGDAPEHMVRRVDMAGALRSAATGSGRRLHATLADLDVAVTLAAALGDRQRQAMTEIHRSYVGSLTGTTGSRSQPPGARSSSAQRSTTATCSRRAGSPRARR